MSLIAEIDQDLFYFVLMLFDEQSQNNLVTNLDYRLDRSEGPVG